MNLNSISNDHLLTSFEHAVRSERKITNHVLELIGEIDRRKLYLRNTYTSLFDFLVKDFGYSPGAAMRRIDAARLLRELPETAQKFREGTLTLSQATQVQRASREFKKTKKEFLSAENKLQLIAQIENATQKQTEQIISTTLDLPIVPQQKETLHRDQSVTLTITFTQEQMQILQQAQNMISHSVVSKDWAAALTYLANKEVKRRTAVHGAGNFGKSVAATAAATVTTHGSFEIMPSTTVAVVELIESSEVTSETSVRAAETIAATVANSTDYCRNPFKRRALPAALRKGLLHEHAACAYKDANGKICGSRRFLQIDHIRSLSRGGANKSRNLQVLCGVHNRLKFQNECQEKSLDFRSKFKT